MSALLRPKHHILVVAATDGEKRPQYALECPAGVTDACRAYHECLADDAETKALDRELDDGDDEPVAHGRPHKYIDSTWMVATDDCLYVGHDQVPDCGEYLTVEPGRYNVGVEYKGDGDIDLIMVGPAD